MSGRFLNGTADILVYDKGKGLYAYVYIDEEGNYDTSIYDVSSGKVEFVDSTYIGGFDVYPLCQDLSVLKAILDYRSKADIEDNL